MKFTRKKIKSLLKEEIKKSEAPITGFLVACAIITKKDIYLGHNFEQKDSDLFTHAEIDALEKVLMQERHPHIQKIFMLGGGKIKKYKNYTPCTLCCRRLLPYMKVGSSVELVPLTSRKKRLQLDFDDVIKSYIKLSYSKIKSRESKELYSELSAKTLLKGQDLDFIVDLVYLADQIKAGLYITGSSSGRGGISNLIMKKTKRSYNDLDLIFIAKSGIIKIQHQIEKLIEEHYSSFSREDRFVPKHKNKKGVVIKNPIYQPKNGPIIDLTFAKDIDGAIRQQPYEEGNWYHQLA